MTGSHTQGIRHTDGINRFKKNPNQIKMGNVGHLDRSKAGNNWERGLCGSGNMKIRIALKYENGTKIRSQYKGIKKESLGEQNMRNCLYHCMPSFSWFL